MLIARGRSFLAGTHVFVALLEILVALGCFLALLDKFGFLRRLIDGLPLDLVVILDGHYRADIGGHDVVRHNWRQWINRRHVFFVVKVGRHERLVTFALPGRLRCGTGAGTISFVLGGLSTRFDEVVHLGLCAFVAMHGTTGTLLHDVRYLMR